MADFPQLVTVQPGIAVEGDFSDLNPRFVAQPAPGQGAYVTGPAGLTVGAFAWADPTNTILTNNGQGPVTGFVGRAGLRADIITFLANASMLVLAGQPITCWSGGGFFAKNRGTTAVTVGMKAYANYNGGAVTFAATGTPPTGATATSATLQKVVSASTGGALPTTNTATGYITAGTFGAPGVLTVTAVGAGSVLGAGVGQTVSGTGIDPNTAVLAQLSGTAGGVGTYSVTINQAAGSSGATIALTLSGGGLTLTGANTTGVFAPGMTISGTNIPTGTTILAYGTGTAGGAGTYLVDRVAATAATASTITAANAMFFTADASSTGVWVINGLLTGSGVGATQYLAAGNAQNANLTGTGGAGTYLTSAFQGSALTAQTISQNTGVETKWIAMMAAAAGELVAISDHPLG